MDAKLNRDDPTHVFYQEPQEHIRPEDQNWYEGPITEYDQVFRTSRWPWYLLSIAMGIIGAAYVDSMRIPLPWSKPARLSETSEKIDDTGYPVVSARLFSAPNNNSTRSEGFDAERIPSQPGLLQQTNELKLPPLSKITIRFKEEFESIPSVYLRNSSFIPSHVGIEEVTTRQVVIHNKDASKDCHFTCVAEGTRKKR